MKQVRATQLENFRRFRDDIPGSSEQQVVDSLTGAFEGNNLTNIGTAFHYIIEKNDIILSKPELFKKSFGVTFSDKQIILALNHAEKLGTFTPEIRLNKPFNTRFGEIYVTGKTDVLQGLIMRDTKVTFKPRNYDYYFDSCQWKIYLSIFGLDRFMYDVFEVIGYDEKMGRDISACEIKQHEPMEMLRYEKMESDIDNLLGSFVDWVDYRCLWDKLQEAK